MHGLVASGFISALGSQLGVGGGEVIGGVDADGRSLLGDGHTYGVAGLEPAELLQRLGLLQPRLRQSGDLLQHLGAIGVHADVGEVLGGGEPFLPLHRAGVGDDGTGEVQGTQGVVEDHLDEVWAEQRLEAEGRVEALHQGGNLRRRVVEAVGEGADLFGIHEGLVALQVDDHVGLVGQLAEGLAEAVGAGAVRGGGHDDPASEAMHTVADAGVVGGHIHGQPGTRGVLHDVLDDGLVAEPGQRFAGEARGGVASRYDDGEFLHVFFISSDKSDWSDLSDRPMSWMAFMVPLSHPGTMAAPMAR